MSGEASPVLALAEQHLRSPKHHAQIVATEAHEGWSVFVAVEFKDGNGGGKVWHKEITDILSLKQALALLGIKL